MIITITADNGKKKGVKHVIRTPHNLPDGEKIGHDIASDLYGSKVRKVEVKPSK